MEKDGGRCDILVNNAGICPMSRSTRSPSTIGVALLSSKSEFDVLLMTKAFADGMRAAEMGPHHQYRVGYCQPSSRNLVHYISSKAEVIGFTRSLATEFGEHGVNVNAIAPGLTRTPGTLADKEVPGGMSKEALFEMMVHMQSIKRGKVSPIIGAVSFLASDDAAFITGQTLYVNGGLTRTT